MSLSTGSACWELESSADRNVRSENERLREKLKAAQDLAVRYTTMLREGDHRIKNSLQIVSSLMVFQGGRHENPLVREALRTAATRIQSVARMHDSLQGSGGQDAVNLGDVLEMMGASLHAMGGAPLGVEVRVSADPITAPVAFAQPISLAVNELVVNALRHGFPGGRTGAIDVKMRSSGGQIRVLVADDGVGMLGGHSEGNGFGMKLVRMMIERIAGTLYVDSGAGTRVTIVAAQPALVAA